MKLTCDCGKTYTLSPDDHRESLRCWMCGRGHRLAEVRGSPAWRRVTEGWARCTEPTGMLDTLCLKFPDRKRGRKFYLVGCAVCRGVWEQLDDTSRRVVEVGEEYAEGRATLDQFIAATRGIRDWDPEEIDEFDGWTWPWDVSHPSAFARRSLELAQQRVCDAAVEQAREDARAAQGAAGAKLVRCVFGCPWGQGAFNPAWATANDGTAQGIAAGVYTSGDFSALPILADALEDAGCDDEEALGHLRNSGPHVRGCWVVDLVLGKQ